MHKDKIKKFLAYDGKVSCICADTTNLVEEMRKIHDLTPTTTAVLGRVATASVMMSTVEMKEPEDSYTIQINGKGPVGTIIAVTSLKKTGPIVKAYIQNPQIELPIRQTDGKIDVGGAVGTDGFLNVIYKNEMTKASYSAYISLVSGEIAEDFTEFFVKSKQKPTAMALGVLVDANGVKASGGYILQPMPDATEEVISSLEKAIASVDPISKLLNDEISLEEIAKKITGDEKIQKLEDNLVPEYSCNCSKEKFENGLISLGKEEIEKMIAEEEKIEICCQFCQKNYTFSKQELQEIQNKIITKDNE